MIPVLRKQFTIVSVNTAFQEETNIYIALKSKLLAGHCFSLNFWWSFKQYCYNTLLSVILLRLDPYAVTLMWFLLVRKTIWLILNFWYEDVRDNYLLLVSHFFILMEILVQFSHPLFKKYHINPAYFLLHWHFIPNSIRCCRVSYANYA